MVPCLMVDKSEALQLATSVMLVAEVKKLIDRSQSVVLSHFSMAS